MTALAKFLRSPWRKRARACEAAALLCLAGMLTLLPPRSYTRWFGGLNAPTVPEAPPDDIRQAREIGRLVARVAEGLPFKLKCLETALALRQMLVRRGIPAVVHLGVNRSPDHRANLKDQRAAHAWVSVGGEVVSHGGDVSEYAMVAHFG